jgi:glutamine amidotransferase
MRKKIAVVNTGVANVASVLNAFERLGIDAELTVDPGQLQSATHIVLPGVGTAGATMLALKKYGLETYLTQMTQPVLGICLGMQLFYEASEETEGFCAKGNASSLSCLGILPGVVKRLDLQLTVPHMGWNQVEVINPNSRLLAGIPDKSYFYFVHSYAVPYESERSPVVAFAQYEERIPAVVEYQNFFGTQFHPERSGHCGQAVLRNFVEINMRYL